MKKIISILLVLAMCFGVLAACNKTEQESPLENARKILFKNYNTAGKGEENKIISDQALTTVVMVDGVSYPVEWTVTIKSGKEGGVVIAESETKNSVTLKLVDRSEDLHYTLTATVKDTKGNTETMTMDCYTPLVEQVVIPTSDKIFIFNPDTATYVTGTGKTYTSSSGSTKEELEMNADSGKALALTMRKDDAGTVTFVTDDGKYLFADGTDVMLVDTESDNTKFVLEEASGGFYLKCYKAEYGGKSQYLEAYSKCLTVYGFQDSKAAIYTFKFEEAKACDHASVDVAAKAATCTEDGNTAGKKCSKCGVILEGVETIKAPGHDWGEWETTKEATATEAGEKKHTCKVDGCGATETQTIPATGSVTGTTTVTVVIEDYAGKNSWIDGNDDSDTGEAGNYMTIQMDGNVTVSLTCPNPNASYGQNSGHYFTSNKTWRVYQAENATLTVAAASGKTIVSVKITFTVKNGGVLVNNSVQYTSDQVVTVNADSITFDIGNTGTATNGQAQITAIEVVYG